MRCSLACHPTEPEVACGCRSGVLRVFDAAGSTLVQESRQHRGAVQRLAYGRNGRLLLSLGEAASAKETCPAPAFMKPKSGTAKSLLEFLPARLAGQDGCLCAYDATRAYQPIQFVQAGFPLHATAMAVSQDGKLLAVASLAADSGATAAAGARGRGRPATACRGAGQAEGQPVVTLFRLAGMQQVLQAAVPGHSRVRSLHLLPGGLAVLALTADGRLLALSCADGTVALCLHQCLAGECTASALDPSGTLLAAATSAGLLKFWGLGPLLQRMATSGTAPSGQDPISSLACQEISTPGGSPVLDAVFAEGSDGLRLLTAGQGADVCCWSVHGHPAKARLPCGAASTPVATSAAALAAAAGQASQAQRPVVSIVTAEVHGSRQSPALARLSPPGLSRPVLTPWHDRVGRTHEQAGCPSPRPLPAALQALAARPPSAPTCLQGPSLASPASRQRPTASLPPSPPCASSSRAAPVGDRAVQQPLGSLIITATHSDRCAQEVRLRRQLRISSPCKASRLGPGSRKPSRTAVWVEEERAEDRIPPHGPQQHLRLTPPMLRSAHLHGFDAAAGFCLQQEGSETADQRQQLLYSAGNVVLQRGPEGVQRQLARMPRRVTALSAHGGLVAAAVAPMPGEGRADVCLVRLGSEVPPELLSHHSFAVEVSLTCWPGRFS